jgi:hypothetical protein
LHANTYHTTSLEFITQSLLYNTPNPSTPLLHTFQSNFHQSTKKGPVSNIILDQLHSNHHSTQSINQFNQSAMSSSATPAPSTSVDTLATKTDFDALLGDISSALDSIGTTLDDPKWLPPKAEPAPVPTVAPVKEKEKKSFFGVTLKSVASKEKALTKDSIKDNGNSNNEGTSSSTDYVSTGGVTGGGRFGSVGKKSQQQTKQQEEQQQQSSTAANTEEPCLPSPLSPISSSPVPPPRSSRASGKFQSLNRSSVLSESSVSSEYTSVKTKRASWQPSFSLFLSLSLSLSDVFFPQLPTQNSVFFFCNFFIGSFSFHQQKLNPYSLKNKKKKKMKN